MIEIDLGVRRRNRGQVEREGEEGDLVGVTVDRELGEQPDQEGDEPEQERDPVEMEEELETLEREELAEEEERERLRALAGEGDDYRVPPPGGEVGHS